MRLSACSRATALGLLVVAPSCSPDPSDSSSSSASSGARPDVLLVTIDTLRADHVGSHGSDLGATPALDALAAEGAVFVEHYSVAAHTAPVHATLLTGLHPREHGLHNNGQTLSADLTTLAQHFADAGYRTGAFIGSAVLRSEFRFDAGFEVFDEEFLGSGHGEVQDEFGGPKGHDEFERPAGEVVDRALAFLAQDDDRPVFLWVHVYDPHAPYEPPPRWEPVFSAPEFNDRRPVDLAEHLNFQPHMVSLRLAAYANEVRYTDEQMGRLFARWSARPREGVAVVTADHGEGLFEHGYRGHGFLLYEEQLRVPLIVHAPADNERVPPGSRVTSVTSAVDVAATLLDLARLRPRGGEGPGGASLLAQLGAGESGGSLALAERRAMGSEELMRNRSLTQLLNRRGHNARKDLPEELALIDGTWKLIWTEGLRAELYDLAKDPDELRDLAEVEPERTAAMAATLRAWWEAAGAGRDAADSEATDPEVDRMLRALGY